MEERDLKNMQKRRLVDLMEGIGISRSTFPTITLKNRVMEEVHHRDRHTAGPPIGRTCLHSWMNRTTDEFEDQFDQYVREYNSLSTPVHRKITLDQFCGLKFRSKNLGRTTGTTMS
jgi:hypothetical protein